MSVIFDLIKQEILSTRQPMRFSRFMDLALYAPHLGYYQRSASPIGKSGDFITAPLLTPRFAECLAEQVMEALEQLTNPIIIEFGAGTGVLAAGLLTELGKRGYRVNYQIIDVSEALKSQQVETIKSQAPDYLDQVTWLNRLPEKPCQAVVIANEVLDAMPVARFEWLNEVIHEIGVDCKDDSLALCRLTPSIELLDAIKPTMPYFQKENYYASEVNLYLQPWLKSLSDFLAAGLVLLIDYGFPRHEYYHIERKQGTLVCHYQHRLVYSPLEHIGEQDITAHVDFTAVAEAGLAAGFMLAGYVNQANFLINCGLLSKIDSGNAADIQAVKCLTMPQEMGELFKVMGLSKNLSSPLMGFQRGDCRHKLS